MGIPGMFPRRFIAVELDREVILRPLSGSKGNVDAIGQIFSPLICNLNIIGRTGILSCQYFRRK
ncbi:hypothetical protein NG99_21080 [Erwinia typographi]|uniref:Uncharacterized protein n=1 Tax=Erwinia typographi TaxID=371042 RepID=A0A0A3YTR4_9GAMM|nr:hypothetical protein NG99_21080 [Erwinia typographi]